METKLQPVVKGKEIVQGKNVTKVTITRYKTEVLTPHAQMKKECKTIGGARAVILALPGTTPARIINLLRKSKDQVNYKILCEKYKANKYGTYNAFTLRQCMYKNEEYFKTNFKK